MLEHVAIEWVLAHDEHGESLVVSAAGTPPLLPQRRARAWPACDDDRIESADIDPELERIGGRDGTERALAQSGLECSPLLRQVAASVCRDGVGKLGIHVGEFLACALRDDLGAATRAHEGEGALALAREVDEDVSGLGKRRPARSGRVGVVVGHPHSLGGLPQDRGDRGM